MPSFSPAKMNGSAEGSMTLRKICRRFAPKLRTVSMSCWLVVRMPASVLMMIGKTTSRATTITFETMPMPNHRMNSGASATVGVA